MKPKTMQQLFRLTTEGMLPVFLEIEHPDLEGGVIRIVNAPTDLEYNGETYRAASFKFTPPEMRDGKYGNATLTISCITQEVIEVIRTLQSRATATAVAAFAFDDEGVLEIDPIEEFTFVLTNVTWSGVYATWQMIFDDRMSVVVPVDIMTALSCPGCAT